MGAFLADLKYGLRMLVKHPGLASVSILALGVGLGLTTTMWSIVYGAMLRGLPFEDGQRIMAVQRTNPEKQIRRTGIVVQDYDEFVRGQTTFSELGAYYTGTVFEVYDLKHNLRAVAGGGRYDKLCALMSDGNVDMSAAGFAMGDVVLGILLKRTPGAQMKLTSALLAASCIDAFVVIADEAQRPHALAAIQLLRATGIRIDYPFGSQKVGKQFQAAEDRKARFAIVFGAEYPEVIVKNLVARSQTSVPAASIVDEVLKMLAEPAIGPLIA